MNLESTTVKVSRAVKAGQFKEALADMERLVSLAPTDNRLKIELADVYVRAGENLKASETLVALGARYEAEGANLKAAACYTHALRLTPKHREASLALGRYDMELGNDQAAAKAFQSALESSVTEAQRLEVLQALLEADPENLKDRVHLAEAFSAQGKLQDAATTLRYVVDRVGGPEKFSDFSLLAERLLYHAPDDANVSKQLAAIYVSNDEPQRALSKLKKAYEARPEDLEVLSLLADTFGLLGQIHKSVAVLKEMARLYDQGGLVHERDECYSRVLTLDPNDRQAREVLGATSNGAIGETFELAYHHETAVPASTTSANADYDLDGEVGFGGTVENTIVDDAFLPEDLRDELAMELHLGEPASTIDSQSAALQDDLRELDFYIASGLVTDAEALLKELITRHGGDNPMITKRVSQVEELKA